MIIKNRAEGAEREVVNFKRWLHFGKELQMLRKQMGKRSE